MPDDNPTIAEVRQLEHFVFQYGGVPNHLTLLGILRSHERLLEAAKDRRTDLDFGKDVEPPEGFQLISVNAKVNARHWQFAAENDHRAEVDFHTFERWKGRIVKVVYPAIVSTVNIGFNWYKGEWRESLNVRILLLNPSTGKPYARTNIKGELMEVRNLNDIIGAEELLAQIRTRTRPTTRIEYTVHEIPLEDS